MTVKQGDIVMVHNPTRQANGSDEHVAIVTAAFHTNEHGLVNVKVLPDLNGIYDFASLAHRDDLAPEVSGGPYWYERE